MRAHARGHREANGRIIGRTIERPRCGTRTRDTRTHGDSLFLRGSRDDHRHPRKGKPREPSEEMEPRRSRRMKEDLL